MKTYTITINEEEKLRIQMALLDDDLDGAMLLLKEISQRLSKSDGRANIHKPNLDK